MGDETKSRPFSIRVNKKLLARLIDLESQMGRSRAEIIDRALEEYIDRQEAKAAKSAKKPAQ